MAFRLKFWGNRQPANGLVGTLDDADQDVQIEQSVLDHCQRWQQHGSRAPEAGGQIFGFVSPRRVEVKMATGPYPGDERERYHYRSDPRAAQQAIYAQARQGLLYLGEWHTHAEDIPVASISDLDAINTLRTRSKLCTSSLLLLIVGRSEQPTGLSLHSIGAGQKLRKWNMASI
ncbi:MAG: hypothetical protein ACREPT_02500 [Rudaea sp.]